MTKLLKKNYMQHENMCFHDQLLVTNVHSIFDVVVLVYWKFYTLVKTIHVNI